jgi:hypothetical protein
MFGSQLVIAGVGGCAATGVAVVVVAGAVVAPAVVAADLAAAAPLVVAGAEVGALVGLPAEVLVVVAAGAPGGLATVAPVVVVAGAEVGSFEYSTNANVNDCSGPPLVSRTFITIVVGASLVGGFTFFRSASSVLPSFASLSGNDSSSLFVLAA